ncbi:Complex III assembly protein translocase and chaperone [Naganishia albida]|nr:Complex III assembly protein translocase and chaperone [Naganishia albida]
MSDSLPPVNEHVVHTPAADPPAAAGITGLISGAMENNPYFSAGAGLMGIGVALTLLRRSTTLVATLAHRRLLVTLEIPSKDRSYPWFLEWMAANAPPAAAEPVTFSSRLTGKAPAGIVGMRSHELAVETTYKQHENGSSEAMFNLVPGPGTHYFKYKGAWMQVKRERDSKLMDLHSGTPWETITLTTLSRDRHLFPSLLSEARALADRGTEGKTVVYTAWGTEWRPLGKPRRKRDLGSVVLAEGMSARVVDDLKRFLGRGKWYAERGIPYRRGYLFHGPPGSGKTSFIQALAGALSYNICVLNLSERGLTDDKLNYLLGVAPERSFILLEDIDAAFNKRVQTSEDGYKSAVTFSGLLNALDGVTSSEERIIFMTTNHFSLLDPALVRPGRVDVKELLDDAMPEQAERLFVKFYGTRTTSGDGDEDGKSGVMRPRETPVDDDRVRELGKQVREIVEENMRRRQRVSMASLQGHFIRHGVEDSLETLGELFAER